jgi:uncharacterized protein (DUF885 family)
MSSFKNRTARASWSLALMALAAPIAAQDAALNAVDSSIATRYEREDGNGAWGIEDSAEHASDSAALAGWSAQLAAIDPASLSDRRLRARLFAVRGFVAAIQAQDVCRFALWNVDQLFGFQAQFAATIGNGPLGTPTARNRMLNSAARIPEAVRRQLTNLRAGLAAGYAAPRANVERVVGQLDAMLDSGARALQGPAARDTNAAFDSAWRKVVADSVAPAFRRYRDFLATDYLAHARAEPGLTSLPHGPECYSAILWGATTIRPDLDSMYAIAVQERVKVGAEILKVGKLVFGPNVTLAETLRRARSDPALMMHDPDSIIAAYTMMLDRARTLLPKQFAKTPDGPVVIKAISKAQAPAAAPAQYSPAPRDGSTPAFFFVNAYQPGGIARMNIGVGASHEGYPGHHFQFVYAAQARAASGAPAFLSSGTYLEGWGIYAEQLADEAGLFDTPLMRLGYLIHRLDVYVALQVDIGMHARGWTRAQAIDTMMAVAGRPLAQAASYADRSAATPGQLATYGIGDLAITGARSRAEAKMGAKFDLKGFHAVVLDDPSVTLPELERAVMEWAQAH